MGAPICAAPCPGTRRALAQEHTQGFLSRFGTRVSERSYGLLDAVDPAGAAASGYRGHPLPLFASRYEDPDFDPVWPAAATALHLRQHGAAAGCSARLRDPRRLLYDGYLSPPACAITDDEHAPAVSDGHGSEHRHPRGWTEVSSLSVAGQQVAIIFATSRRAVRLHPGWSVPLTPVSPCSAAPTRQGRCP